MVSYNSSVLHQGIGERQMLNMKKIAQMGAIILCGLMLTACGTKTGKSPAKQEVSGPMTKVGQYQRAEEDYPQATLLAIKHYNKTFNVDGATIKITTGKLIQMDATTKRQRDEHETNFGEHLGKKYYVYQVEYVLTNTSDQKISEEGLEVITPRGDQLTTNNGAVDFGSGATIQAHAKKTDYLQALVKKSDKNKMDKFKIVSPEIIDNDGITVAEAQTLSLAKSSN